MSISVDSNVNKVFSVIKLSNNVKHREQEGFEHIILSVPGQRRGTRNQSLVHSNT